MMNKMSFQLISNIFSNFSFEHDRRRDGQMDRASYRGAMAHQKIISYHISESFPVIFALFSDFQLKRDQPTDKQTELVIEVIWRT